MRRLAFPVFAFLFFHCGAIAQTSGIPPSLQTWESWVMHGQEFRRCPLRAATSGADSSAFMCRWPGRLHLFVSTTGGEFSQRWQLYADGWATLPGSETNWPEQVTVEGRAVAVVAHEGAPRIFLRAGSHTVRGRFSWSRRPESLQVPSETALFDLSIDGNSILPIEVRDARLWLGAAKTVSMPRALEVHVYRLLEDDIPLQLTTEIHLKASGDAREEVLAPVLPQGFVPTAASGPLPARFEADGRLRVQIRSGEHVIAIRARAESLPSQIQIPEGEGFWSNEEIWSYQSNDRLRVTAIESAEPIDPIQAGAPWRHLPTYSLVRGATITVAERSRGLTESDANRLTLRRDLWMAFDRRSFTAVDNIHGTMQQGWRLDMQPPYRLQNARIGEETLLITDATENRTGVEVRTPSLSLTTLARTDAGGRQPATGWNARFENVSTTLHLPPGHLLLAAFGADESPDAWINRWRLLDLFVLMLVTAAAFKLLGWGGAAIAAGALLLTYHEASSPAWLWVNLLVAIGIVRVVPQGRFRRWASGYQAVSLLALLIVLVPFSLVQYKLAIHPQLEASARIQDDVVKHPFGLAQSLGTRDARVPRADGASRSRTDAVTIQEMAVAAPAMRLEAPRRLERYAPNAMLQTGPGIPAWQYLDHHLSWNGPVDASQRVRLIIVSPLWLSVWRIVGLILCAALVAVLVRIAYGKPQRWPRFPSGAQASSILACLALFAFADPSAAQTPDPTVLAELKKRLSEPAKCAPSCAEIVVANIDLLDGRLNVRLDVHTQAHVALAVPRAGPHWSIESVSIDDVAADAFAREDPHTHVVLSPGVHRISMNGRIVAADELSLDFPQRPHRVAIRAEGWDAVGTNEGRLLNNAIQFTRRANEMDAERFAAQRFSPFVRIRRQVFMNLEWTIRTEVERLAPEQGAFTMRLPLLPGEAVLTPDLDVREGTALISMPSDTRHVTWESSLERLDRLQWSAAANQPWAEQWDIIVSPMWHAEFSGTPPVMPLEYESGAWVHQFLPRQGESLELLVVRPAASVGATLAVDSVNVETTFGQRLAETQLVFTYRSSQGGRHDVRIPADARVNAVTIDEESLPLRPTEGLLPLTLTPGKHQVAIEFTQDEGARSTSRAPAIDLGAEGTNVRTNLVLGESRWVLFAFGKGVGPVILYWGEVVLFIAIALLVGRWRASPLRTRDWLFLGLGLSTFSWWVLLVFAVWLLALERRANWTTGSRGRFNTVQVALALFSVLALGALISAIPYGLLGRPDMDIRTNTYDGLAWFVDQSASQLPRPAVVSVSIWYYKLAMLVWALWLSFALLRWLPWAWRKFSAQGMWKAEPGSEVATQPGV